NRVAPKNRGRNGRQIRHSDIVPIYRRGRRSSPLTGEAPSSNTQIPNKSQTFKSRSRSRGRVLSFLIGICNFFGAWMLGFGISRRLFLQGIDSLGEIKIKLRQTALAVG